MHESMLPFWLSFPGSQRQSQIRLDSENGRDRLPSEKLLVLDG